MKLQLKTGKLKLKLKNKSKRKSHWVPPKLVLTSAPWKWPRSNWNINTIFRMASIHRRTLFAVPRSYASTVLGVVIWSASPSVTRALWQNQTMHCEYFDTTRNSNHSSFLTPTVVGGRCRLPSEICTQHDPPPQNCRIVALSLP